MTTRIVYAQPEAAPETFFMLPDPPGWDAHEAPFTSTALLILRRRYAGRPDAVVIGQGYLCFDTRSPESRWLAPDCLVAFGVSYETVERRNGYVIDECGKTARLRAGGRLADHRRA